MLPFINIIILIIIIIFFAPLPILSLHDYG